MRYTYVFSEKVLNSGNKKFGIVEPVQHRDTLNQIWVSCAKIVINNETNEIVKNKFETVKCGS